MTVLMYWIQTSRSETPITSRFATRTPRSNGSRKTIRKAWLLSMRLSRVPDLTRSADIKLNTRVSLRPILTGLSLAQVAQMAIVPA
jgi:hypothetical protein